ncbi:MAG: PHP domain-containing protein [Dehalococcoidia bacterium]|nr:PHP domain-containing protein [Dehalococcoidia bacterium]
MSSIADFHTHSNCSDGVLPPSEVVDLAAARGVRMLALTDHDTLDGIAQAQAAAEQHPDLTIVPGVELSCEFPGNEVHLLGLFVDTTNPPLARALELMQTAREDRGRAMVERLQDIGVAIEWERVEAMAAGGPPGRPHIARALIEAGAVASIEEAFERYLARGRSGYVERARLGPEEAIELVHRAGGLAVFAHPPFSDDFEAVAERLAAAGVDAIEVYYRDYPPERVDELAALARRLGLCASGGSDFHAFDRQAERAPGEIAFPDEAVHWLLERARDLGCAVPAGMR